MIISLREPKICVRLLHNKSFTLNIKKQHQIPATSLRGAVGFQYNIWTKSVQLLRDGTQKSTDSMPGTIHICLLRTYHLKQRVSK
jgi:hypothetical protein